MINYFNIFDIEQKFEIDSSDLEVKYLKLQKTYHPDKAHLEDIRIENLKKSADINEGYQILKSDVGRAEHLLELNDIRVNKDSNNSFPVPQKLLLEQMELREKVFEAEKVDLPELQKNIRKDFKDIKEDFSKYLSENNLQLAAEKAVELRYMMKLMEEIKKIKKHASTNT